MQKMFFGWNLLLSMSTLLTMEWTILTELCRYAQTTILKTCSASPHSITLLNFGATKTFVSYTPIDSRLTKKRRTAMQQLPQQQRYLAWIYMLSQFIEEISRLGVYIWLHYTNPNFIFCGTQRYQFLIQTLQGASGQDS